MKNSTLFFDPSHLARDLRRLIQHCRCSAIADRAAWAIYLFSLIAGIAVWLRAVRAPLWLDETGSYWQISSGFSQIWPRQFVCLAFPAYSYVLWLSSKFIGTSEVALRIPSILAMLAAVYMLYLAAREMFGREIGLICATVFALNPIVVFESVDVRPYAFVAFAVNTAILILIRLRTSSSLVLAGTFGFVAAVIVAVHYLAAVILPALLLCFIVFKLPRGTGMWKQLAVAIGIFALAFLPLIPGFYYDFRTSKTHVFEQAPYLQDLFLTLVPPILAIALGATGIAAAWIVRRRENVQFLKWHMLLCLSLALIPVLILYGVSVSTPMHTFVPRHRLVAIPGITLCWAMLLSPFRSRALRVFFCLIFVGMSAMAYLRSPHLGHHSYTWKYAILAAEKSAASDDAPVLICSDFPDADYIKMPTKTAKTDLYYAPLSYYQLSAPVVPLPRTLNAETVRAGSEFLDAARQKHQRFLAMAYIPSYPTLDWLTRQASRGYSVHTLGTYDGIKVLEFVPETSLAPSAQ